jgi:hypothetical protein
VDKERFDRLTRAVSQAASRRGVLRGFGALVAGILAGPAVSDEAAARLRSVPLGGVCYNDRQCYNEYVSTRRRQNPDLQIVYCADNGFTYDGAFNCCRYSGGACYVDEDCCGTRVCAKQFCKYVRSRRRARHPRTRVRRRR